MNVNASSSANSLRELLSTRAAQSVRSGGLSASSSGVGQAAARGTPSRLASSLRALSTLASQSTAASRVSAGASAGSASTTASTTGTATAGTRPTGLPPPPARFEMPMSTSQFAGMGGRASGSGSAGASCDSSRTGQLPSLASLDQNGDGSVSSSEFGLDGTDDMASALFDAVDSDDDGSLSSEEVASFESQMSRMMQEIGMRPMAPPPSGDDASQANASSAISSAISSAVTTTSSDVTSATATGKAGSLDLEKFIQQLAARYASTATHDGGQSTLSLVA